MWAAQSGTVLLDTVAALERLRSTLDAVVMPVVAEVDATDAAKAEGWSSTKDFLTAVTGGHRGAGAGLVRLARELTGPRGATLADLAGGRISRVQAEVVTRAVDQLPGDPVLRGRGEAVMSVPRSGLWPGRNALRIWVGSSTSVTTASVGSASVAGPRPRTVR